MMLIALPIVRGKGYAEIGAVSLKSKFFSGPSPLHHMGGGLTRLICSAWSKVLQPIYGEVLDGVLEYRASEVESWFGFCFRAHGLFQARYCRDIVLEDWLEAKLIEHASAP